MKGSIKERLLINIKKNILYQKRFRIYIKYELKCKKLKKSFIKTINNEFD